MRADKRVVHVGVRHFEEMVCQRRRSRPRRIHGRRSIDLGFSHAEMNLTRLMHSQSIRPRHQDIAGHPPASHLRHTRHLPGALLILAVLASTTLPLAARITRSRSTASSTQFGLAPSGPAPSIWSPLYSFVIGSGVEFRVFAKLSGRRRGATNKALGWIRTYFLLWRWD